MFQFWGCSVDGGTLDKVKQVFYCLGYHIEGVTMRSNTHRSFQDELAEHLRSGEYLTFTELEIPGTADFAGYNGRVDVVAVKPHQYVHLDLRAYECKVTRQDFLADINSGKWRKYLQVFHHLFFAVPSGLVKTDEVPAEAGLIVRGDKGWRTVRVGRRNEPPNLNMYVILAMLYRGPEMAKEARDLRLRLQYGAGGEVESARNLGYDIARRLKAKDHPLAPALESLREMLERVWGEPLDSPVAVYAAQRNLERALYLSRDLSKHREALDYVVRYLGILCGHGYLFSEDAARERADAVLEMPLPA